MSPHGSTPFALTLRNMITKERVSRAEAEFRLQKLIKDGFVLQSKERDSRRVSITLKRNDEIKHYTFTNNGWLYLD